MPSAEQPALAPLMPELIIPVGENIGPGYIDWETWDYVPGFTVDDIRMRIQFAEYDGEQVDSILLQFGICYGGIVRHAVEIYNYLRGLGIPVRAHILSLTASSGTIVALAADEVTLEHTAQWMVHRPLYTNGTPSQRSEELRADADWLDRETQNVVDIYAAHTGKDEASIRQLISVDRVMTAQEALDFGFATAVKPLVGKAPSAAEVTARLRTIRQAVARADKRAVAQLRAQHQAPKPTPRATNAAPAAAPSPRPMATTKKPAPAAKKPVAAPKPAAAATQKPVAMNAAQQAVAALARQHGLTVTMEAAEEAPAAELQSTELSNGAFLYHDGALAVDVAVFNDEAMTEATGDGVYDAADGRAITVASGIVTDITEASAEGGNEAPAADANTDAITAAIHAALAPLNKRLDDVEASFKKIVPPAPRPTARAVQTPDPKAAAKPTPRAAHHAQL